MNIRLRTLKKVMLKIYVWHTYMPYLHISNMQFRLLDINDTKNFIKACLGPRTVPPFYYAIDGKYLYDCDIVTREDRIIKEKEYRSMVAMKEAISKLRKENGYE